ncbi:Crp/Fnr family transcriptional regulator [Rhodocyclus tenuis]|uniref:CRP/FNR family transcriptional regulator n=1 Tax=Rhodocyclus tenuis TaxID=1066 RepID=A0A840FZU2_RHOTE|nr:Crp/Fnr family transcriptional regulator [Rhodocyclus tenuis]MBB4245743.1 CRP/FNR family transcriptional regulator [Rhodocyclus tenuis]
MSITEVSAAADELFARYPALRTLPAADLASLLRPQGRLQVPGGGELFAEHSPCLGFPLLLEGTIKVVKSAPNGREMLLYRVEPGGSCIITSSCLLGSSPYSARGVAETPVTLRMLPTPAFDRLLGECPPFRGFVFQLFAERIAALMQRIEEIAFQRLDQRLARLLLGRSTPIRSTHQALAEELGSVREIVSRLLKSFADQGLVALGREQITLLDRERLQGLADAER